MFDNIITDLFPNTKQLYHDIGRLKENIAETLVANGYYKSDEMYNKIRQLWDTIGVRHGVMLVGPTGSGKTVNWQTLKESINKIATPVESVKELQPAQVFRKVQDRVLNPKAILNEQIYGQMNQITKE